MNLKPDNIRKPAAAGTFYPKEPVELAKTIAGILAETDKTTLTGRPLGLIVPHAGYPYSGAIAAKAFKLLEGEEFETVVIVSPSHTVFFKGCSVYTGEGYETPLGVVGTDLELARKIAEINPVVYASNQGHATGSTRGEHALEVQLPFLQVVLGKFKLVPIVMGDQEEDSIRVLGEVLAAVLKGKNCLLVASTDLSHFHPEKEARQLDGTVQKAIEAFDPDALINLLSSGKGEACGGGPVAAVMAATKRLGCREISFLDYNTSGAVTGDFSEVVGYLSAAIIADKKTTAAIAASQKALLGARAAAERDAGLSDETKATLHRIAYTAIDAHLNGREYTPESSVDLDQHRGAFVTLKIRGDLRGCIGQIRASQPLGQVVAEMAVAAAFEDPRFEKLTEEEQPRLRYEISVLTPLARVQKFSEIRIGRDGLMIKLDTHSGLLLPQVASENGWNVTLFLEQICLKAGLPKESYKDRLAEIYRFSAEVF